MSSLMGQLYRAGREGLKVVPGGRWLLGWTDPLHIARRALLREMQAKAPLVRGRMLDIGCGMNPYRELFVHVDRYVSCDVPPNPHAEVLGDGMQLPFESDIFDGVLCNQVLEHVPEPARLIREAARVLKPNGVLLLTTPQTWGPHLEPHDYYRYTRNGLRFLAETGGLSVVEIAPTCGMWATLAQRLADTVVHTYAAGRSKVLMEFLSWLLAPVQLVGWMLDRVFGLRGDTLDHVLVAMKPTK